MHTFFLLPSNRPIIRFSAALAAARSIGRNFQVGVIGVWLLDDRLSGGCWRGNGGGDGWTFRDRLDLERRGGYGRFLDDLWGFWRRRVIDFGVFAGRTWWDGEEFLECQDAGFTAFPACAFKLACSLLLQRRFHMLRKITKLQWVQIEHW